MVGDDEVEAEAARGFSFSEGAHAGVDGDDEADAVGVGGFEHARLHAVAVAQAMGNMKADDAAKHFDGGFEQDDGDGAVDVVVAVEEDGLARGDGAFEALDGGGHAEHEKGIVEVGRLGIEEGEGLGGRGDAARNEQLGENEWQTRFAGRAKRTSQDWVLRGASAAAAKCELQWHCSGARWYWRGGALTLTRPRRRGSARRR